MKDRVYEYYREVIRCISSRTAIVLSAAAIFLVTPTRVEDENGRVRTLVDSGVCQCCLRECVLPEEEYHTFIRRYCYVRYVY